MPKDETETEQEEDVTQDRLISESNVFTKLLGLKDKVFHVESDAPFMEEPLRVYYAVPKEGEVVDSGVEFPKSREELDELTTEDRLQLMVDFEIDYVWSMINKAQEMGDSVPEQYRITKQMWDDMGKHFPFVRNDIIGKITGGTKRLAEGFLSGPKTPRSES